MHWVFKGGTWVGSIRVIPGFGPQGCPCIGGLWIGSIRVSLHRAFTGGTWIGSTKVVCELDL